jgi:pimeloyl-ACP methyl ester carboxylesterase
LKAYIEAITVPGRWDELHPDKRSILFDNVATAIRPEAWSSESGEVIRKFHFPVLMLTGEKNGDMLRAMRGCLPDGVRETVVIPNASHGMNRENPQDFDAAVLRFLSADDWSKHVQFWPKADVAVCGSDVRFRR